MNVTEGFLGTIGDTPLIRLSRLSAATGHRCVIAIPDNQSPEKMELLRAHGLAAG